METVSIIILCVGGGLGIYAALKKSIEAAGIAVLLVAIADLLMKIPK